MTAKRDFSRAIANYPVRECPVCGKEYKRHPNSKYCSDKCGRDSPTQAAWRASPRGRYSIRKAILKRKFGLTPEEYDQMLADQGGVCAVCKRPPKRRRLGVDHDHATGLVRGLLCDYCNYRVIGRHGLQHLEPAVEYLKRHEQRVQASHEDDGYPSPRTSPRRRKKAHSGDKPDK